MTEGWVQGNGDHFICFLLTLSQRGITDEGIVIAKTIRDALVGAGTDSDEIMINRDVGDDRSEVSVQRR